jgi:transposase-like protein
MEIQKSPKPLQPVISAERLQMVEQFRRSGLTRKAFSRQYGVPLATLQWWLSKAKRAPSASTPVTFSEVKVIGSALDDSGKWAMEVESTSGVKVRCREALPVRTLERLLRGARC